MLSLLSCMFSTERYQRRSHGVDARTPFLLERVESKRVDPVLVTNPKGRFLLSRQGKEGLLRCGLARISIEEESILVSSLIRDSLEIGLTPSAKTIDEALSYMTQGGFKPSRVIVGFEQAVNFLESDKPLEEIHADVGEMMSRLGKIGTIEGLEVVAVPSIHGCRAIVVAEPSQFGVYTRVGDFVGLTVHNVNRTMVVLVNDEDSHELVG